MQNPHTGSDYGVFFCVQNAMRALEITRHFCYFTAIERFFAVEKQFFMPPFKPNRRLRSASFYGH
jgi:hypothetical protein